jgi:hypothetical protein
MSQYISQERFDRLLENSEKFELWHEAYDAAVERNKPIIVNVGGCIEKIYPSRRSVSLVPGDQRVE